MRDASAGEMLRLPRGVTATLLAAHPDPYRNAAAGCGWLVFRSRAAAGWLTGSAAR